MTPIGQNLQLYYPSSRAMNNDQKPMLYGNMMGMNIAKGEDIFSVSTPVTGKVLSRTDVMNINSNNNDIDAENEQIYQSPDGKPIDITLNKEQIAMPQINVQNTEIDYALQNRQHNTIPHTIGVSERFNAAEYDSLATPHN